ncbi:MAG: hypothetical protein IH898_08985 [Planctomycetes bacterium]|nr:hypothetical protein [Planctomycetota bacterium]
MGDHLVHIGEVIVNAIVFDPKNSERLRTMDLNNLLQSVQRLFDLLEEREVPYVLVGGIAMLIYVEGRNTQDIDLIVPRDAMEKLTEIVIEDDNPDFARAKLDELQVDLLFTHNDLFNTVAKNHTVTKQFVERSIRCATVEAIIMLKLFALPSLYRQGSFEKVDLYQNDVLRLLREFDPDTEPVFAELARHMLPSDVEELRKIVAGIEEEIAQARHRFGKGEH